MSRTIIEALNCHWPARISVQDIIISHTTNRNGILNINLDLNRVRLSLLSPHTTNVGRQFSCKTAMLTELPLSAQLQTKAQYPRNYPSLHSYKQKRNTHGTTPLCTATDKSAIPTELPLSAQLQTKAQYPRNYPSLHSYKQKRNTHGTTPLCTATNKSAIPTELPLSAQLQTKAQYPRNYPSLHSSKQKHSRPRMYVQLVVP